MIINFEGIHGCGKTTQSKKLLENLQDRGLSVKYIGSSDKPLSKYGMDFLRKEGKQDPETLFYLSLANNYSIQRLLREHHKQFFILDRYIHTDISSTLAGGVNLDWIRMVTSPFVMPDLVFLLDLDPSVALERRFGKSNAIEEGKYQVGSSDGFIDYQRKIREAYLIMAKSDPRMQILDGSSPIKDLGNQVMVSLEGLLKKNG